eukprot:5138221-Pleurochrysis_carterae.AAC.1
MRRGYAAARAARALPSASRPCATSLCRAVGALCELELPQPRSHAPCARHGGVLTRGHPQRALRERNKLRPRPRQGLPHHWQQPDRCVVREPLPPR